MEEVISGYDRSSVQESLIAISSDAHSRELVPKNWVWPVMEGNWAVLARKNVWATYSDKAKTKVQSDDRIAFYVKGTGNFRGIYRLASDWYSATKLIWYDEIAAGKVTYKHQVKIEPVELGSANYKSLVHSLAFVKNKAQFQVYIQSMGGGPANHGRPITDEDLEVVAAELRRNPSTADEGPLVEETERPVVEHVADPPPPMPPLAMWLPWVFQDLESVSRGMPSPGKYVEGRDPAQILEDLVFLAFRFLGYNTSRQLGYRRGGRPGPDGEARSSNTDYVVVYDAKQRIDSYTLSQADYRALREYVEEARSRGDQNVFCMVLSSSFGGGATISERSAARLRPGTGAPRADCVEDPEPVAGEPAAFAAIVRGDMGAVTGCCRGVGRGKRRGPRRPRSSIPRECGATSFRGLAQTGNRSPHEGTR